MKLLQQTLSQSIIFGGPLYKSVNDPYVPAATSVARGFGLVAVEASAPPEQREPPRRQRVRLVRGVQPPRAGPAAGALHGVLPQPVRHPVVPVRRLARRDRLGDGAGDAGRLHAVLPAPGAGRLGLQLQLRGLQLKHGLRRPLGLQDDPAAATRQQKQRGDKSRE